MNNWIFFLCGNNWIFKGIMGLKRGIIVVTVNTDDGSCTYNT